jgi:hypothetical protein
MSPYPNGLRATNQVVLLTMLQSCGTGAIWSWQSIWLATLCLACKVGYEPSKRGIKPFCLLDAYTNAKTCKYDIILYLFLHDCGT